MLPWWDLSSIFVSHHGLSSDRATLGLFCVWVTWGYLELLRGMNGQIEVIDPPFSSLLCGEFPGFSSLLSEIRRTHCFPTHAGPSLLCAPGRLCPEPGRSAGMRSHCCSSSSLLPSQPLFATPFTLHTCFLHNTPAVRPMPPGVLVVFQGPVIGPDPPEHPSHIVMSKSITLKPEFYSLDCHQP